MPEPRITKTSDHPCGCREVYYQNQDEPGGEDQVRIEPCVPCAIEQAGALLSAAGHRMALEKANPKSGGIIVPPPWMRLAADKTGREK